MLILHLIADVLGFEIHLVTCLCPKDLDAPDRVLIGGQDQEPDGTSCITYTADLSISRGIGLKSCQ